MKVGSALGIGIDYPLLAFVGFSASGDNSPAHLDGFRHLFAFVPVVSELLVVYVLYR